MIESRAKSFILGMTNQQRNKGTKTSMDTRRVEIIPVRKGLDKRENQQDTCITMWIVAYV